MKIVLNIEVKLVERVGSETPATSSTPSLAGLTGSTGLAAIVIVIVILAVLRRKRGGCYVRSDHLEIMFKS